MKHVSFRTTLLSSLDDFGSKLLGIGKIWILWTKIIDNILRDEDRFNIYREALKYNSKDDFEELKNHYQEFIQSKGLAGDQFLNYAFFEKEV
jgi:hypothetical protein